MNCAAIPHDLLESEIFGHVKGAFTGATRDRKGAAMRAHGGTLFLDEICEMDLLLQSKLLRFIQERTVQRVGDDAVHPVDVRIVCATNRDPMGEVRAGRFREDLFYRLHVVPVILPPLRDRGDDVLLVAEHFLKLYAAEDGKPFSGFTHDAELAMMAYHWPGNVRELQNMMRTIVVMNEGGVIGRSMLPPELVLMGRTAGPSAAALSGGADYMPPDGPGNAIRSPAGFPYEISLRPQEIAPVPDLAVRAPAMAKVHGGESRAESDIVALEQVIRRTIEEAIRLCGGSIPKAAHALDVSPSTVYRRLQAWEAADREKPQE